MTPSDLKTWRTTHNWTQTQAAENLGISLRHYQKLEGGAVEISRTLFLATQGLHFRKNRIHSIS